MLFPSVGHGEFPVTGVGAGVGTVMDGACVVPVTGVGAGVGTVTDGVVPVGATV